MSLPHASEVAQALASPTPSNPTAKQPYSFDPSCPSCWTRLQIAGEHSDICCGRHGEECLPRAHGTLCMRCGNPEFPHAYKHVFIPKPLLKRCRWYVAEFFYCVATSVLPELRDRFASWRARRSKGSHSISNSK